VSSFRPAAAAELDEAYRWYERERSGLGDEFLQAARSMLELIGSKPLTCPVVAALKASEAKRVLDLGSLDSRR
jgi:hypothetical protein